MNRVLLTGADGYIGRPLQTALLARNFEVHAISRSPRSGSTSVIWHALDLFDNQATDAILADVAATHLVHLAWVTEPGAYWQSPDNSLWQNASIELLERFSKHGGERAVLVGTCAEYDWTDGHCAEETTPLRAQSPYTSAKLAFRDAAIALAEARKLQLAWARVFFSFGPNEHEQRLVPAVIRSLLSGQRAACSDGRQRRDFMYVDDMADAIAATLDSAFSGDINIASGKAMTIRDLVTVIAAKLAAVEQIDFGARQRQQGDPDSITADVTRLTDVVGWTSSRSFDSAIDETIAWWRQHLAH